MAMEKACRSLDDGEAEDLCSDIVGASRSAKVPKSNLSSVETKAQFNLKKSQSLTILHSLVSRRQ